MALQTNVAAVEHRVNRGLSLRGLAREVGVDARTLAKLEGGGRIHASSAKKVADYYGVQVTDLISTEQVAS